MGKIAKVKQWLYNNEYAEKLITQPDYRARLSLWGSCTVNVVYSAFKLVTGFIHGSLWIGAVAVYYLLVSAIRYILIFRTHMNTLQENPKLARLHMLQSYEVTGWWMLGLNILITIMGGQMLWMDRVYDYPDYMLIGAAGFTFYCLCNSIYNLIKYRKMQHPLFTATKNISLTCALLSILSLQTSLIARFGDFLTPAKRLMSNSITGAIVMISIFAIAANMVLQGKFAQKKMKELM